MTAEIDRAHAARMNAVYRHQKHIYDLSRKFFLLGRDGLIEGLDVPAGGSVLEVGCGTGRNLLLAAKRYPQAELQGLDISSEMLEIAERSLTGAGCSAGLHQGDACSFATGGLFAGRKFDRVFFSYALSMIPDWRKALNEARAALAPGGSIHVVDFGQQERLPNWFRSALFSWLARFHVEPRAGLFDALNGLTEIGDPEVQCGVLLRGYAWHGVVRSADVSAR